MKQQQQPVSPACEWTESHVYLKSTGVGEEEEKEGEKGEEYKRIREKGRGERKSSGMKST